MREQVASAAGPPWSAEANEAVSGLSSDVATGLSSVEAARRLARDGPNELAETDPPSLLQRFASQFSDPLVLLLLGAIVVSLLAWWSDGADGVPVESVVIAVIVLANACIGVWQEDARSTQSPRSADSRRCTPTSSATGAPSSYRQQSWSSVTSFHSPRVTPSQLIARLVENHGIEVSEAALTGESLPIAKSIESLPAETAVAERSNMVFSGTAVTKGRATGVVTATAQRTEVGRIAELIEQSSTDRTPLQRQIDQLSRWLGITVVILAVLVVGAIFATSDISTSSDALDALLVAVSLAVAAVPEGLPAILTVVLALGVQRMAGHQAIVKRLLSVETLGAASVICTDKTGTLTRNEMTAIRLAVAAGRADVSGVGYIPSGAVTVVPNDAPGGGASDVSILDDLWQLLRAGVAANDASLRASEDPVDGEEWIVAGDPTEIALLVAAEKHDAVDTAEALPQRVDEMPFDSERKLMTTLHGPGHLGRWEQYTKGAPDVLLERCTHELRDGLDVELTESDRKRIRDVINDYADDGLRTLAVARRHHPSRPERLDAHEHGLTLLGIIGIADPAKADVLPVIAEAARAGVRTVMVTGDHPRTARAIGRTLGMRVDGDAVVVGDEISRTSDVGALIEAAGVFARVAPEDKLHIVEAYQQAGHIVAMTGDGVNDAPALRQADIGVAMGRGGTEVARDAADMILADDDFGTIVRAIREGREIFADIRKFLRYLLASNCGEVLVMIIGVLAAAPLGLSVAGDGLAVPLLATQILWINLLTDSALALALGVDPSVDDVMSEPPRRLDEPIIDRAMWVTIALIGTVTALAGLVALDIELEGGMLGGSGDLTTARTMLFSTVVLAQVFNAFNARSDRTSALRDPFANRLLWAAVAATVVSQIAVVHLGPLNRAFDTTPLDAGRWALCLALASTVLIANEVRKLIVRTWPSGR